MLLLEALLRRRCMSGAHLAHLVHLVRRGLRGHRAHRGLRDLRGLRPLRTPGEGRVHPAVVFVQHRIAQVGGNVWLRAGLRLIALREKHEVAS